MLAVGVVKVHYLDDGGVPIVFLDKIAVIKIPVPLVHRNSRNLLQCIRSFGDKVHLIDRFRHDPGLKGCKGLGIDTFGHPVMTGSGKTFSIGLRINEISP